MRGGPSPLGPLLSLRPLLPPPPPCIAIASFRACASFDCCAEPSTGSVLAGRAMVVAAAAAGHGRPSFEPRLQLVKRLQNS